ncbi:hypothetical protein V8C86DRAFT_3152063 [Haematococcus lacustris]
MLHSVGQSHRHVSDSDMVTVLQWPPGALARALPQLQELALPYGLPVVRSLIKSLLLPLTTLRLLDLSGTSFSQLRSFATWQLSRLPCLDSLLLNMCDNLLPSHLATLHLVTSLRRLEAVGAEVVDWKTHLEVPLQLNTLVNEGAEESTVAALKRLQDALLSAADTNLSVAQFVIMELSRCTGLTALNLRDIDIPGLAEDAEGQIGMIGWCLIEALQHSLTSLDLSSITLACNDMAYLCDARGLTELHLDDVEFMRMGSEDLFPDQCELPDLRVLSLRYLVLTDTHQWHPLSRLTQLSDLDLSCPDVNLAADDPVERLLHHLLPHADQLRKLSLMGWGMASLDPVCLFTGLQSLNLDEVQSDTTPFLHPGWCDSLPNLHELSCRDTFLDDCSFYDLLSSCKQLTRLHLRGSWISDDGIMKLRHRDREWVRRSSLGIHAPRPAPVREDGAPSREPIFPNLVDVELGQPCPEDAGLHMDLREGFEAPSWRGMCHLSAMLPRLTRLSVRCWVPEEELFQSWLEMGTRLTCLTCLDLMGEQPLPGACLRRLAQGRAASGPPFFPVLAMLLVTDKRSVPGGLGPSDVDLVAAAVAAGGCALRQLVVADRDAENRHRGFRLRLNLSLRVAVRVGAGGGCNGGCSGSLPRPQQRLGGGWGGGGAAAAGQCLKARGGGGYGC